MLQSIANMSTIRGDGIRMTSQLRTREKEAKSWNRAGHSHKSSKRHSESIDGSSNTPMVYVTVCAMLTCTHTLKHTYV